MYKIKMRRGRYLELSQLIGQGRSREVKGTSRKSLSQTAPVEEYGAILGYYYPR